MLPDPLKRTIIKYPHVFLLLFTLAFNSLAYSQISPKNIEKFSPALRVSASRGAMPVTGIYVISVSDTIGFRDFMITQLGVLPDYVYSRAGVFIIRTSWRNIIDSIVTRTEVLFIDVQRIPKEEVAVSNFDISTNKGNLLHNRFPLFDGQGLMVSVKENRPDTTDIDYKGRYVPTALTSTTLSSHATIMSTIIAGAGNTYYEGKGFAKAANLSSANFTNLLPEPEAYYQQYNISVQNHSYGTGIENYYGADAMAYDANATIRPALLHVFSAGNSGTQASAIGPYAGIAGYANLTGSFKMAKNIITVGHTDSIGNVLAPSSKGPAYDGRVKPDLVAFGLDGSSGAAAIVSGIALSLQDAYKKTYGSLPPSDLIKAVLLNSADDTGPVGIDYASGYGSANACKAMQGLFNNRFFTGTISQGGTQTFGLTILPNCKLLKVTLVWNDPPAAANASKSLRNDLDLQVSTPVSGNTWLPWVLSHAAHADSLLKLPVRKRDTLNNVEQVTIDNPIPGDYELKIIGTNLTSISSQPFAIVFQLDTLETFTWYYPGKEDNLFPDRKNLLRWESNLGETNAILESSIDKGASWQPINSSVNLSTGYLAWTPKDTFTTALLRMRTTSQVFTTDTFTISKRINTYVGFNCPDSFLFYWNRVPGVNRYQVYRLGEKYMEPFLASQDTLVLLPSQGNPFRYYAIAPILDNKTGVRSYGFNYETQGVECYIRTFLATSTGNAGRLELVLGSIYRVQKITLEKFDGQNWLTVAQTTTIAGLIYNFTDPLLQGANIYRIRIDLQGDKKVYSDVETVYYLGELPFIVYPNPVARGQNSFVLAADVSEEIQLQVYNLGGQKIYETSIVDIQTVVPTGTLSKGLYFYRFTRKGEKDVVLKLMVQ